MALPETTAHPRHRYVERPDGEGCCTPAARPCPGGCNAAYRAAERATERELLAAWAENREPQPIEKMPRPRLGEPWWCAACAGDVVRAIGRLPELAALLWDAGHEPEPVIVRDIVSRKQVGNHLVGSIWQETLTCRHLHRYVGDSPENVNQRVCGLCAVEAPSSNGRLAPAVRSERRSMTPVSPSGSPSWDAIDEVVSWAAEAEDLARALLGLSRLPYGRERSASTEARARVLSASVHFLTTWSDRWLQTRRGVEVGHAALRLVKRAERSAGEDTLVHRLPAPCPVCDRMGLQRTDGSDQVDCRYCKNSWPEDDYRRLTLVLASEAANR